MNILVTGANGQLGNEIRIASRASADRYIFTDINAAEGTETLHLDITDRNAVHEMVMANDIKCIINCAAYTDVDGAESNEALAMKLNAEAPGNLAAAMKEAGGLLVHISTDYVFGGEVRTAPYTEEWACSPTGVYGVTKLRGEEHVMAAGCEYIIIRTSWLYSEFGRNFCKTIMRLTAERDTLNVVNDQTGTPTYARDLAEAIVDIVGNRKYEGNTGIYHYSNEGICTWFDFAKAIAAYAGHRACEIRPCSSDEFPSPVRRPAYSVLDKTKTKRTFGLDIPHWSESLARCIANIKK